MLPFGMDGNSTKPGYDTVPERENVRSSGIDRPSFAVGQPSQLPASKVIFQKRVGIEAVA
jgi:hypothetical protein